MCLLVPAGLDRFILTQSFSNQFSLLYDSNKCLNINTSRAKCDPVHIFLPKKTTFIFSIQVQVKSPTKFTYKPYIIVYIDLLYKNEIIICHLPPRYLCHPPRLIFFLHKQIINLDKDLHKRVLTYARISCFGGGYVWSN